MVDSTITSSEKAGIHRMVRASAGCKSRTENIRGQYSSALVACQFRFHKAEVEDIHGPYEASSACEGNGTAIQVVENGDNFFLDYATRWPDECVGDFRRCYSIELDERVFIKSLCMKHWKVPPETTHISVDCTADRDAKMKSIGDLKNKTLAENMGREEARTKAEENRQRIYLGVAIGLGLFSLIFSICCACCGYRFVVRPYLAAIKRSRSDPDLRSLVATKGGPVGELA